MNNLQHIQNFYRNLYKDDFIGSHGFELYRIDGQDFYACASTLKSKAGRQMTCSFNIHDGEPEEVELVIQLLNKSSLEQIKVVGEKLSHILNHEINVYDEEECISLVLYYSIHDIEEVIHAFKIMLEEINKVVFFILSPDDK